jgi:hypothetical protein
MPWNQSGLTAAAFESVLTADGLNLAKVEADLISKCVQSTGPQNPYSDGS